MSINLIFTIDFIIWQIEYIALHTNHTNTTTAPHHNRATTQVKVHAKTAGGVHMSSQHTVQMSKNTSKLENQLQMVPHYYYYYYLHHHHRHRRSYW